MHDDGPREQTEGRMTVTAAPALCTVLLSKNVVPKLQGSAKRCFNVHEWHMTSEHVNQSVYLKATDTYVTDGYPPHLKL